MKSVMSERGSTLVVIVIMLAIVLLGVLGFVFWQNYTKEDISTGNTNTTQANTTNDTDTDEQATTKQFTISEWGITADYMSDATVRYQLGYPADGDPYVELRVDTLASVGNGETSFGLIYRRDKDAHLVELDGSQGISFQEYAAQYPQHARLIGDYYYQYAYPQAARTESGTPERAIEERVAETVQAIFDNLTLVE